MASPGKIPVSGISTIDHQTDTSNLNILVGVDEMYGESLSDSEECFVMVDDDKSVDVMTAGGSSVQQLLSHHETSSIGVDQHKLVQRMQMDSRKTLEIVSSRHREHIKLLQVSNDKTVEVLPMEDGKTVEIVQMDRHDKTIEVVDMDSMKHSEVIHIDGSSSIELLSVEDGTSLKRPTILKKPPQIIYPKRQIIYSKRKSKGTENPINALSPKKKCSSENIPSSLPLSLGSLASINSFEIKAPKIGSSGHQFSPMPSVTTLVTSRQSQVMENDLESITHVTPSIILSNDKRVVSSSEDNLNNSIIISWSSVHSSHSSVETQTEPYVGSGPSFNMFSCTFYKDGSVETQCDMPVHKDMCVSTDVVGSCGTNTISNHLSSDGSMGHLAVEKDMITDQTDSTFLRSSQTLKLKHSLFKSSSKYDGKTDLNANPDEDFMYDKSDIPFKKKRGRKKKKRYPLNDDFDYDLNFENTNDGENVSISGQPKTDIDIKEEPVDHDDEAATNILKTKGYGLRTKRRLKKMNDMHYMEEKVVKKKLEKTQDFPCQYCAEVFPNFTRLQKHAKEQHDSTCFAFPCEQCGVVFTRPHNLERHKDTKHGDGEKRFVCDQCGRRFGRQDVLAVHISMVHYKKSLQNNSSSSVFGPNTFHCTSCDQFFSKEQKLKAHREGNLSCSECDLSFECKATLRNHQYKRHPTSCGECGKVCSSKHQLYLHRLSHDPKHICNICQKGFLWKSQYVIHMSTHTGEKPELCDICGKSFAHKLAVNKHKWQEHDESKKKFKCETCGKRFVYKAKLQSHMRSHTGEKPFHCELCSSAFTQRCNLTAHIKSVHGVYIQSIKNDGTTQTQLVKYKRVKKQPSLETQPTVNAVMTHSVEPQVHEPQIAIQEQVQMSSESFETEAAVYQIVYAYQQ